MIPRGPVVIRSIAWVTVREILRDKLLYNTLAFAVLLIGIAFLAARLSFIRPERILINFGTSGMSVALAVLASLLGAQALLREFDRRTIWVALAHPITRYQFVWGKFAGVALVLAANALLLTLILVASLSTQVNEWHELWRPSLFVGIFFIFLQSLLIAALALFFASFTTFSLAVGLTLSLYLIGNSISQIRSAFEGGIVRNLTYLLPNLENFSLGFKVTYDLPVGVLWAFGVSGYAVLWCFILILAAGLCLQGKES